MWQYNFTYLCHANNYKYVDKYRDKRGNWQYVYPDDVPQKARTMSIRNDKPTNALNKGYSGQDYGKSGNTRFANVKDQISLDIKSRAAARENEKKAADKAYRKAVYNSAAAAQEATERARGEASAKTNHPGVERKISFMGKPARYTSTYVNLKNVYKLENINDPSRPKSTMGPSPVKIAKDVYDYDKAAKTSQMLKDATARQKKYGAVEGSQNAREKAIAKGAETAQKNKTKTILNNATARYEASTSRTDAAQNSREAAIQKSAKATQARNEEKRVADMKERSKYNAWHDQTWREFEIQKAARKQQTSNESKKAEDNIKNLKKNIMKGDYEAADKNLKDLRNNEFFADDKKTSANIYKQLRDLVANEKIKNKTEKDGVSINYNSRQVGEGRQDLGEQSIEHIYDNLKEISSGNKKASLSDQANYIMIRDMIKNPDRYGISFENSSEHDNKRRKQIVELIEEIIPNVPSFKSNYK